MSEERLLIIGLGNPLMGDDGAGIQVVNELKESYLPGYVDVIDGGTPGVGLIDLMSGYNRVIVVDAVKIPLNPPFSKGEIRFPPLEKGGKGGFEKAFSDEILVRHVLENDEYSSAADHCSLHEMELSSVLRLMQVLGIKIPEITIVGIPAVSVVRRIGLSEECRRFIPQAVKFIRELNRDSAHLTSKIC